MADGARCGLASQHRVVVGSILRAFGREVAAQAVAGAEPAGPYVLAPLLELDGGVAELDLGVTEKQLDWSTDAVDSGEAPVERLSPQHGVDA